MISIFKVLGLMPASKRISICVAILIRGTLVYRFLRNLGTAQALGHLEICSLAYELIFEGSTHNLTIGGIIYKNRQNGGSACCGGNWALPMGKMNSLFSSTTI